MRHYALFARRHAFFVCRRALFVCRHVVSVAAFAVSADSLAAGTLPTDPDTRAVAAVYLQPNNTCHNQIQ